MEIKALETIDYEVEVDAKTLQKFGHILFSDYNREFSAVTHAERVGNKFYMYDLFLPSQENDFTNTTFLSKGESELFFDGCDIEISTGHIHSHVNMPVFASPDDVIHIKKRAYLGGYNVSLILNKKGDIFAHIVDYNTGIYLQKVPVKIRYPFSKEEFSNLILTKAKEATTLEELREIANFSEGEFFTQNYPLTEEEIEYIEICQRDRFTDFIKEVAAPVPYKTGNFPSKKLPSSKIQYTNENKTKNKLLNLKNKS